MEIGRKIINFKAESTNKDEFILKDQMGGYVVMFFYPKDNTPGCTQEGLDFSNNLTKFKKLNTKIYGVSRDSIKSHDNFKNKYKYKFDLISDPDEYLCNLFDVIKEKNMYGKKYMGIERSTFIIDPKGTLIKEWRKVKVNGHSDEVLQYIKNLN
ncbi:MAG: peroxiredoxin [Gammaproteobacteria bacterium]|nr:peroxiredoxin [Gammaproteobacteria bacterium]MBT6755252.1 peroxiredoxin [Gammaproteobacteria bacterium]MBT7523122.1 peroxiredoxin [Gammaproteobacteria bacterium]MBT7814337.1 peroxiredoxin [Gammaproteobacteria bacterium]